MESRVFPNEIMKKFIECYRDNIALWRVGSKEYQNRTQKAKAYEKLIDVIKDRYPEADKDFVVRKINSLRSCFRKEYKKVVKSRREFTNPEDVYKPSLWYYDLLLFTADCKDWKEQTEPEEAYEYEVEIKKENNKTYETSSADPLELCLPLYKPINKSSENEITVAQYETQKEDEYDAYGITVAAKLRKMTEHQRLFSENLINQILFKGMFNKLSENTVLYECLENEQNIEIMGTMCTNNL